MIAWCALLVYMNTWWWLRCRAKNVIFHYWPATSNKDGWVYEYCSSIVSWRTWSDVAILGTYVTARYHKNDTQSFTIVIMFYEKKGHTFNPWWFWWRRHHRICCLNGQQLELSARVNMKTGIIVQFTPYGYDDYDSLDWWWWWLNRRTFIVVLKRINSSMIIYCNLPELVRLYRLVHGLSDLELTLYFIL